MNLVPSSWGSFREYNACHVPGGRPDGGQFGAKGQCQGPGARPVQPTESTDAPENREAWDAFFKADRQWKRDVTLAVSLGQLTQKEAEGLGWYADGNAQKGYEELPGTLFHVSTAYNEILRQGLKTRFEIGGVHRGLGGGADDTISFTTDLSTARSIRAAILEARRVARGELTVEQMVRMSQAQPTMGAQTDRMKYLRSGGDNRSAYEMLVSLYAGSTWTKGQPIPDPLDRVLRGVVVERPGDSKDPALSAAYAQAGPGLGMLPVRMVPPGYKPLNTFQGRDEAFAAYVERPMSRDEKLDAAWEMFKRYSTAREHAGGRMDPLFFLTDREALAKVPVRDIKIMQFTPRPGARGYRVSALGEWRVHTGRAVKYSGLAESG
jgi:hypothetical protein